MSFKLILEPWTYINTKTNSLLAYNTLDGNVLFKTKNSVIEFFENLEKNDMIFEEVSDENITTFLKELQDSFMIEIIECKDEKKHLIPFDKEIIINDFKKVKNEDKISSIQYLNSLNLYINSECGYNCSYCSSAYRQLKNCFKSGKDIINFESFKLIIKQLLKSTEVNLLGGDILTHPELSEMLGYLNQSGYSNVTLHINANTLHKERLHLLDELSSQVRINIITEKKNIEFILQNLKVFSDKNINLIFLISQMEDYMEVESFAENHFPERHEYKVFYDNNIDFFKENVFTEKEDIFSDKTSVVDIMTKKIINTNFFGKMAILSNGNMYFNLNFEKVSNVNKTRIHSTILEELKDKSFWFMQREGILPCKNCVYNELCPSISNYELAIGKYNLCHYNPDLLKWKDEKGYAELI